MSPPFISDLIKNFHENSQKMSHEEKVKLLEEILFHNARPVHLMIPTENGLLVGNSGFIQLDLYRRIIPAGQTIICRARKISDEIKNPTTQDFWEPAPHVVNKGRLNTNGESLLYLADNPLTAISEIGESISGSFMLMVYELTEEIALTEIGFNEATDNQVLNFLDTIFLTKRDNSDKTPDQIYDITNHIAKRYKQFGDGWVYPSTVCKGTNFCVLSSRKSCFNLIAAINVIGGKIRSKFTLSHPDKIELVTLNDVESAQEWDRLLEISKINSTPIPDGYIPKNSNLNVATILPPIE